MTHDEALRQHLPERYLLGELRGEDRERFEEHLFGCPACAADVEGGAVFLGSARQHFREETAATTNRNVDKPRAKLFVMKAAWPFAIAAMLLVMIGYQNLVQVPRLKTQLARAEAPAVLQELVLAGSDSRGEAQVPAIGLRSGDALLLSVDIPGERRFAAYRCVLLSDAGAELWRATLAGEQARDAVPIRIPARLLAAGANHLRVEGVNTNANDAAQATTVADYHFNAHIEP